MNTFKGSVNINVPADKVDLYDWVTNVTEKEYQSFAPAHRAIGLYRESERGKQGMVNVESIGGNLLVQHYIIKIGEKNHLLLYSKNTLLYLLHLVPINIGVKWEMKITESSKDTSTFTCVVSIDYPSKALKWGAVLLAGPYFVNRHTQKESLGFAKDMERKFTK